MTLTSTGGVGHPLRVLVVSSKYPPEYSGSGLRAHSTYTRLSEKFGVEFDVLAGSVQFNDSVSYALDGVPVRRVAGKLLPANRQPGLGSTLARVVPAPIVRRMNYLSEAFAVFRFLRPRHQKYDVFHVFGNVATTSAAISFAKASHIPLVVEMTSDRSSPHGWEPWIIGKLWGARLPDRSRIVCISERLRHMCEKHDYVENVWSRPNPIDEAKFFPEPDRRPDYRRRYTKFGDEDVVLSYVAKVMPSKNQRFLIEVLGHLPSRFKLVLAGPVTDSGPLSSRDNRYLESIHEAIASRRLQNRIQLIPEFVEAHEVVKASDVYLFPSINEGLGTPVIEAIACGVPVVANLMEGITDQWIQEGESGFLSALDSEAFASKVESAAKIPRDTLLRKSQEILDIASAEVIDRQYWELLQEVRDTARRVPQPV